MEDIIKVISTIIIAAALFMFGNASANLVVMEWRLNTVVFAENVEQGVKYSEMCVVSGEGAPFVYDGDCYSALRDISSKMAKDYPTVINMFIVDGKSYNRI